MAIAGYRITESGNRRITAAGDPRITDHFVSGAAAVFAVSVAVAAGLIVQLGSAHASASSSVLADALRTTHGAASVSGTATANAEAQHHQVGGAGADGSSVSRAVPALTVRPAASVIGQSSTWAKARLLSYGASGVGAHCIASAIGRVSKAGAGVVSAASTSHADSVFPLIGRGSASSAAASFCGPLKMVFGPSAHAGPTYVNRITGTGDRRTSSRGIRVVAVARPSSVNADATLVPFSGFTSQNRGGVWGPAIPKVKVNGVFVTPSRIYARRNGVWHRAL